MRMSSSARFSIFRIVPSKGAINTVSRGRHLPQYRRGPLPAAVGVMQVFARNHGPHSTLERPWVPARSFLLPRRDFIMMKEAPLVSARGVESEAGAGLPGRLLQETKRAPLESRIRNWSLPMYCSSTELYWPPVRKPAVPAVVAIWPQSGAEV
jgi:hypothetical protein